MNLNKVLAQAAEKAAEEFTVFLQDTALSAGWPPYIIAEMSVREDNGDLYVHYPDNLSAQIEDLEYGTPTSAPNSVIRTFLSRYNKEEEAFTDATFVDALVAMGALA
jgi:hypothetical protein